MANKPVTTPAVGFIDNPNAPDVFADAVTGVFLFAGNLRITFESARVSHVSSPGPINRVVIGRLVLPLDAAKNLRDLLVDYLGKVDDATTPQLQGTPTIQ